MATKKKSKKLKEVVLPDGTLDTVIRETYEFIPTHNVDGLIKALVDHTNLCGRSDSPCVIGRSTDVLDMYQTILQSLEPVEMCQNLDDDQRNVEKMRDQIERNLDNLSSTLVAKGVPPRALITKYALKRMQFWTNMNLQIVDRVSKMGKDRINEIYTKNRCTSVLQRVPKVDVKPIKASKTADDVLKEMQRVSRVLRETTPQLERQREKRSTEVIISEELLEEDRELEAAKRAEFENMNYESYRARNY